MTMRSIVRYHSTPLGNGPFGYLPILDLMFGQGKERHSVRGLPNESCFENDCAHLSACVLIGACECTRVSQA